MLENQAVYFWGLNLGVLRILLFQRRAGSPKLHIAGHAKRRSGRAESPMERLAQGKRSDALGWVIVSKTIYALKGQKRGYCTFVSHTQCLYVFTLLPFQGVDIIFLFHIPRVPLRLPWATRSFGLSARLGFRLLWVGLIAIYMRAKERIFKENSKRAGVLLRGFEADLYIFKQIS